jgi:rhodanese-related sulfurtransferase
MSTITVHELNQLLQSGIRQNSLLIDVRTPAEYQASRIAAVVNRPLDQLENHVSEFQGYQTIYIHCQSGSRSQKACEKLRELGVHHYVNVVGGISAWEQAGLPTVKAKGTLPIIQQVMIAAGMLVLLGVLLSAFFHVGWIGLSAAVGAGLLYAGASGQCFMAMLLAKMPWNAPTAMCSVVTVSPDSR